MVMTTAIIILSVLLLGTIMFLISVIMHILKIQKELISISEEQSDMNNNIIQIYASLNKMQNFQLEQYKFNEEVAKGFQNMADRDLVRQLQDIDPTKIGKA
jgi:predicted Holliday junction resolvase-like endonuclease